MFYLVGIGLGSPEDITLRGLNLVKSAKKVYLESYTSILSCGKEALEEYYGRELIVADREMVEEGCDSMLAEAAADSGDVVLLVIGDPFGATTHTDLVLRARRNGIRTGVVHNASIVNAVACCGLQLYSFGETVSIPFWTDDWKPDSFYDKICANKQRGLHTLCLLDIKVKEPTSESLTKKKREYLPPMFMSVKTAAEQLMEIVGQRRDGVIVDGGTECVGLARVGSPDELVVYGTLSGMRCAELGGPLHSLVVVGDLHPMEREFLDYFRRGGDEVGAVSSVRHD